MKLYAGLDVSQATTAVCIIRENGERVWEGSTMTEPSAIAEALTKYAPLLARAVLESGQLSTWLTRQLRELGLPVICVDARQAHKALSARLNKSDSADAESLAQLARTGWFREVHVKSPEADRLRVVLAARRRLISCRKDIEAQLRGTLKTFGIKLGGVTAGRNRVSFRDKVRSALNNDKGVADLLARLQEEASKWLDPPRHCCRRGRGARGRSPPPPRAPAPCVGRLFGPPASRPSARKGRAAHAPRAPEPRAACAASPRRAIGAEAHEGQPVVVETSAFVSSARETVMSERQLFRPEVLAFSRQGQTGRS